jgi:NADP-dependent 3-hydroxy acid dehydrogenase YdfG
MSDRKVWFITGASRGMGVQFATAALAAGHAVVASGRDTDRVSKALGQSSDLLAVKLDVTNRGDAEAAVRAASIALAALTCWSTTLRASTPATSRN